MKKITPELARSTILGFLDNQLNKKTEKEIKSLAKAIKNKETEKILEIENKIERIKNDYELEVWMDRAANWMANQIGFGSHISKGIHPSSKGDNINFVPSTQLPKNLVGHQSVKTHKLDASGNAAALPLFSLFDCSVIDNKKIKHFIIDNDDNFKAAFSNDKKLSLQYFNIFRNLLLAQPTQPKTSKYNKQILWSTGDNSYTCLIPLYPSSFTNYIFERVNHVKYSDEISQKRKNRFSNTGEMSSYPTLENLAVTLIGGSNPQGVSQLMSKQRGRNYLLPSMPPKLKPNDSFNVSKFSSSIFQSKSLRYRANHHIDEILKVVKSNKNNVDWRDNRKDAIDGVLHTLFSIANAVRTEKPAGWSKGFDLDIEEKFWLDPNRAQLEGEEEFKEKRESTDWNKIIITRFANWINALLKEAFKDIKHEFANPEHNEWEREIEEMLKRYERAGKGVFL
ncbi:type I-F CRISPR-associated protein Csy1 [Suttonella sp. R2A3]|uniref:type I-F CRISPR-associated protein Csy1 n=1 Tax=Suttonella sp. R2A3 TaxID=2908648 RepID=UPI001F2A0F46|nr:type I-F CRISPR-associated protein Csy1 [Suttonella sp. R2A3]UJF25016.1 type I-F CRISPR-associated protein Csy1 [Suttonella sp. R2A3]